MSMWSGAAQGRQGAVGETIARYAEYEAAQKAVSRLIAADVPARDIAIVGIGLRSVERVTGRLGYAAAARSGAVNGLLLGLLFSAVLMLGTTSVPIQAFIGVMFVGVAVGMLLSIVAYSFVRRRRDYASVVQVIADHYDVTVAAAGAQKARQVLGVTGQPTAAPAPTPASPADRGVAAAGDSGASDASGTPGAPADAGAADTPAAPTHLDPPRYGERVTQVHPHDDAGAEDSTRG